MDSFKEYGFTLAEVLITLGIIGVVAAMTIPTLLANVNANQYRSMLKKQISNLSQAGLTAQEQYGFNYGTAEKCEIWKTESSYYYNPEEYPNSCTLIGGTQKGATYLGYSGSVKLPKSSYNVEGNLSTIINPHYYQLGDGAIIAIPQKFHDCTIEIGENLNQKLKNSNDFRHDCLGFIDVNGISKPNEETKCNDGRSNDSQYNLDNPCTVKSRDIKDIYPVAFHDTTVEPATAAGRYVLNTSK